MRFRVSIFTFLISTVVSAQAPKVAPAARETYERALQDWHDGRYAAALEALQRVLNGANGEAYLERIALLTGELFKTVQVAENGRLPRWSLRGDYLVYEVGTGAARASRVVTAAGLKTVADVKGWGLVFAPDDNGIAWLSPRDTTLRSTEIVVRNLQTGSERRVGDGGLVKATIAFAPNGTGILALATKAGETKADVYLVPIGGGTVTAVAPTDSAKSDFQVVGNRLFFSLGGRGAIPAPGGGRGAGGGGRGGRSTAFGVATLDNGDVREFRGDSWAVSADGSAMAWIRRADGKFELHAWRLNDVTAPLTILSVTDSLAAPSLSPDGSRIAFQRMLNHDWDVFVTGLSGNDESRITRENAHDVLPRFLGANRLLAMIGEPRHRRSFLYDVATLERTRLFHNNTVRTIAPEYEWAASPDATKVAIVAERDGDTITPHRHLWLTDLGARITKADLLARIRESLDAELSLIGSGTKAFAPMADDVRDVVAQVSTARIYNYEQALFDFDSKHISKPGNLKAREYLLAQYTSFGYENAHFQPFNARVGGGVGQQPAAGAAGVAVPPPFPGAAGQQPAGGIPTANVIATLRGTENPELVYVISSHFDSRAEGPGADDDGSGTAALLEAARVLARHPLPATVVFASMTAEESGLLGSREFVRQAKDSLRIVGALNNDMIGWANDDRLDNTIRYSNAGIRDIQHAAAALFTHLVTYDAFYYKSTDAASFYDQYGDIVGGIGSYPVLSNPHYHMPHDNLEYENHQLIAETSKATVASIMLLASSPSRIVGLAATVEGDGAQLTWTKSPERSVVKYRVRYRGSAAAPWHELPAVTAPHARLPAAKAGTSVEVKAVNRRGLEGWDWARVTVR